MGFFWLFRLLSSSGIFSWRCSFFRYPDTFSSGVTSTISSTVSCRQMISGSFPSAVVFLFLILDLRPQSFFVPVPEQILLYFPVALDSCADVFYATITEIFFYQTIPGHLCDLFVFAFKFLSSYRSSPPGTTFLSILIQFLPSNDWDARITICLCPDCRRACLDMKYPVQFTGISRPESIDQHSSLNWLLYRWIWVRLYKTSFRSSLVRCG